MPTQMVQIAIGRVLQLEGAEAYVVERLVVDAEGLVGVLYQLVHGEGGVVGLHHRVRHLRRRHHREGGHDPVGVLLPDLRHQQGAHARASASTQ